VLIVGFGEGFHLGLKTSWTTEDNIRVLEPIHLKFLSLDYGKDRSLNGRLFLLRGLMEPDWIRRVIAYGLFRRIEDQRESENEQGTSRALMGRK
jgi:hypothetical protein